MNSAAATLTCEVLEADVCRSSSTVTTLPSVK